jgi:hypothetical protein
MDSFTASPLPDPRLFYFYPPRAPRRLGAEARAEAAALGAAPL